MLLTAPIPSAIAVVRLSGSSAARFIKEHFSREVKYGRPVHGQLSVGETLIDDPVVVQVAEATFDLNLHGGPWIIQRTLALLASCGFTVETPSIPAPISAFAEYDDELQRRVLSYLPLANTNLALRWLCAQPNAWRRRRPSARGELRLARDRTLLHLIYPPRVAIIGLPNVGKSTIANHLFAQQRSIVADHPGTTRDWVGELANLDGLKVMLIDTPGIRAVTDEIEAKAIANSLAMQREIDLQVLVLDLTRLHDPEQMKLIETYPRAVRFLNKTDLAPDASRAITCDAMGNARAGIGVDDLGRAIRSRFIKPWRRKPVACRWPEQIESLTRGQ